MVCCISTVLFLCFSCLFSICLFWMLVSGLGLGPLDNLVVLFSFFLGDCGHVSEMSDPIIVIRGCREWRWLGF